MQFVVDIKETPRIRESARRVEQIAKWLQCHFPAPARLTVRYVGELKDGEAHIQGYCILDEDSEGHPTLEVAVKHGRDFALTMDTLMHEWAHVVSLPFTSYQKSEHCDEFWIAFGRIYRAFFEEGGELASRGL